MAERVNPSGWNAVETRDVWIEGGEQKVFVTDDYGGKGCHCDGGDGEHIGLTDPQDVTK